MHMTGALHCTNKHVRVGRLLEVAAQVMHGGQRQLVSLAVLELIVVPVGELVGVVGSEEEGVSVSVSGTAKGAHTHTHTHIHTYTHR